MTSRDECVTTERRRDVALKYLHVPALITLLAEMERRPGVTAEALAELAGISLASFKRLLANAERVLEVKVRWVRNPAGRKEGSYRVEDWGLLREERVMTMKRAA